MENQGHELTESVQQKIGKALRIGASYELAARFAGIPVKWFWRWKRDGEGGQGSFNKHYYQKCRYFSREIKQARADYQVSCLTRIEQLKNFKALHWKWERLQGQSHPKKHQKNKKRRSERHEDNRNKNCD